MSFGSKQAAFIGFLENKRQNEILIHTFSISAPSNRFNLGPTLCVIDGRASFWYLGGLFGISRGENQPKNDLFGDFSSLYHLVHHLNFRVTSETTSHFVELTMMHLTTRELYAHQCVSDEQ